MESKLVLEKIDDMFRRMVQSDPKIRNAYLLIHSDKLNLHMNVAEGTNTIVHPNQPHYIASISKLFTAVLIAKLVEEKLVTYESYITEYIDEDLLENLHVYKGKEYTQQITIKQLLNHTSGLQDYFEDKPIKGPSIIDQIFNEPSKYWSPRDIIQWSKENQRSRFQPGTKFHYSDTGYHLLGLLIEKITSTPLHQAFQHYIFKPLQMEQSYLAHHSTETITHEFPLARLYGRNKDVTDYRSLSTEFAGGGIVSTSEELLIFMKALMSNELISKESFERMKDWSKYSSLNFLGIDYGYGLLKFKSIPLIMPKKFSVIGNFGSTGSFMFYHPNKDIYIVGNLNQLGYVRKGMQFMFKVLNVILKDNKT